MSRWSLRARLLLVSLTVLLGFVVLTVAALDRAFRESAETVQSQRLEALIYLLMGAMDIGPNGELLVPAQLPEARLAVPGSGVYAAITQSRLHEQWLSNSTLGLKIPFDDNMRPAERRNSIRIAADGTRYRVVSQAVRWAIGSRPSVLIFSVAAPLAAEESEVRAFRRSLWGALGVLATLLLLALIAVQTWGLRPLRRLTRRLAAMEAGETAQLAGHYPSELAPLVDNLNRLLQRERTQLERYRAALGDLAHSLKTPLAVLRGAPRDGALSEVVDEQVGRMDQIVQYQLQRASTAGASQSAPPLALAQLVGRLLATMSKVYADRTLVLRNQVAPSLLIRMDEGDALELLGNLIDNACKWAAGTVAVSAERRQGGLLLIIEDDGPGVSEPDRVLGRGQRGDEHTPGHGIGLAIVQDIALAYRGDLHIERSSLGGARFVIRLGQV